MLHGCNKSIVAAQVPLLHGCHMSIVASLVPYASKISYEYPPNITYASWMSYEYSGHPGSLCFMDLI